MFSSKFKYTIIRIGLLGISVMCAGVCICSKLVYYNGVSPYKMLYVGGLIGVISFCSSFLFKDKSDKELDEDE